MPNELRLKALANPDCMWNLRMKFVEQAKKYFGVPYAKKYWTQEGMCDAAVLVMKPDLEKTFLK